MLVPWRVYHSHSYCSMSVSRVLRHRQHLLAWGRFPDDNFQPLNPCNNGGFEDDFPFQRREVLRFPCTSYGVFNKKEWENSTEISHKKTSNSEWIRYILPRAVNKANPPWHNRHYISTNADFPFLCYFYRNEHIITCGNKFPLLNILVILGGFSGRPKHDVQQMFRSDFFEAWSLEG